LRGRRSRMSPRMRSSTAFSSALVLVLAAGHASAAVTPEVKRCESAVSSALNACVAKVNATVRKCYRDTGAACATGGKDETKIAGAVAAIAGKLGPKCTPAAIAGAGLGADTNATQLGARVGEACRQQAASLVSRTFGGSHAALLQGADAA